MNTKETEGETRLRDRLSKSLSAFRQGSGTPPWLVSEMATDSFIAQSSQWVHLMPALGLEPAVSFLSENPIFDQLSSQWMTEEFRNQFEGNKIRDGLLAAQGLIISANELWRQGRLPSPTAVMKTLPVLGTMFWCPEGGRIATEVAKALGCSQSMPAEVFESYRASMESGAEATLLELQRLVESDPVFSPWADQFSVMAVELGLPERPSPLPFTGLTPNILMAMLETEVKGDNN
jgi:hypothetical protein